MNDAVLQAKECDKIRENKNFDCKNYGLLFGLPMSCKENFILKSSLFIIRYW